MKIPLTDVHFLPLVRQPLVDRLFHGYTDRYSKTARIHALRIIERFITCHPKTWVMGEQEIRNMCTREARSWYYTSTFVQVSPEKQRTRKLP